MDVELRCGKTNSWRGIHGVRHVIDKFSDFVVNAGDPGRYPVQPWIGITQNRQYGHEKLANLTG
jgi:hypothetical protein